VKQVLVEVICLAPENWELCQICQTMLTQAGIDEHSPGSQLDQLPFEWKQELEAISEWIFNTNKRYGPQVTFRIHDPRSFSGLLRALRYNIHRYPAFVINGQERVLGLDVQKLDAALLACGLQPCDMEKNL
jgi:hypothetical protein